MSSPEFVKDSNFKNEDEQKKQFNNYQKEQPQKHFGRHGRHHGGHHGGFYLQHHEGRHHEGRHHGGHHRRFGGEHHERHNKPQFEGTFGHRQRHHGHKHRHEGRDRPGYEYRHYKGWQTSENFKVQKPQQLILQGSINPQKLQSQPVLARNPSSSLSQKQIPQSLLCPISQDLMHSPVMIIVCGHTFEQSIIKDWLKKSKMCPLCKKQADQSKLQKNFAVSSLIEHYK